MGRSSRSRNWRRDERSSINSSGMFRSGMYRPPRAGPVVRPGDVEPANLRTGRFSLRPQSTCFEREPSRGRSDPRHVDVLVVAALRQAGVVGVGLAETGLVGVEAVL